MQKFYEGLAEILEIEVSRITPDLDLNSVPWDSLAVVSTIALVDELFNVMLEGQALSKCESVADIEVLIAAKRAA